MATILVVGGVGAVGALGGAVGGTIAHIRERNKMKRRDKEIEKERQKEIEGEKEEKKKTELQVEVKHHTHVHLLNEVEGSEGFFCGSCKKSGTGRKYRCDECNFDLHKVCSSSPILLCLEVPLEAAPIKTMQTTFTHPDHQLKEIYKHKDKFKCNHCLNDGTGIRFRCDDCKLDYHPVCTKYPTRLSTFLHPEHELQLKTRTLFSDCTLCGHGGRTNHRVYTCQICKFYLHPTCSRWPQYLFHELHPVHPLRLQILDSTMKGLKCEACGGKCKDGTAYRCESCDESFHPECLLRKSISGGGVDRKRDEFGKEVLIRSAFQVGFIGAKCLAGIALL